MEFKVGDKVEIYARDMEKKEILDKTTMGIVIEVVEGVRYGYKIKIENINDLDDRMKGFCNSDNVLNLSEHEIRIVQMTQREIIKYNLLGVI